MKAKDKPLFITTKDLKAVGVCHGQVERFKSLTAGKLPLNIEAVLMVGKQMDRLEWAIVSLLPGKRASARHYNWLHQAREERDRQFDALDSTSQRYDREVRQVREAFYQRLAEYFVEQYTKVKKAQARKAAK